MLKLVDDQSDAVASSEIADLFTPSAAQVLVSNVKQLVYSTANSLAHSPLEFSFNTGKSFVDLQSSQLVVQCKITDEKGTSLKVKDGDPKVGLVNYFGQTFVKQYQLFIGNDLVYDSGVNNQYIAYLNALLCYDDSYKSTVLRAGGWVTENDGSAADDSGYVTRCSLSRDCVFPSSNNQRPYLHLQT